jgi:hypothetical protein
MLHARSRYRDQRASLGGIVKRYGRKSPERKRQTDAKDQNTISITQNAGTSNQPRANSHFNDTSLRSTFASVARGTKTKNGRRQPPHQASTVQKEGVQKICSSKGRQTCRLMATLTTNRNQEFLRLLMSPQSQRDVSVQLSLTTSSERLKPAIKDMAPWRIGSPGESLDNG